MRALPGCSRLLEALGDFVMRKQLVAAGTLVAAFVVGDASHPTPCWAGVLQDIVSAGKQIGGEVSRVFKEGQAGLKELRETLDASPTDTLRGAAVVLYEHINGRGQVRGLRPGDEIPDLSNVHIKHGVMGWKQLNDVVSSVVVFEGTTVTLYEHQGYGGRSVKLIGPTTVNLTDLDFNDDASSVRVE